MIIVDGLNVGTIWMERDSTEDRACDLGLWIADPGARGHGVGAAAIHLAEAEAIASWDIDSIRLRVRRSNVRAISCYRRSGYRIFATTTKEVDGIAVTVHHMERQLIGSSDHHGG